MIFYNYETVFSLKNEDKISDWLINVIMAEGCELMEINYIFCDDDYLLQLNVEFLKHDTLTDIISFDYSVGKSIHGDIYISVERIEDNAMDFGVTFTQELYRVMVHGILHYCGYKDKSEADAKLMRSKENDYLELLN